MNAWSARSWWLLRQTFIITGSTHLLGGCLLPSVSGYLVGASCPRSYTPFFPALKHEFTVAHICPSKSSSSVLFKKCLSTEVGTSELEFLLDTGTVQLIDVREPEELMETGKIPSSVNIPCKCVNLHGKYIYILEYCKNFMIVLQFKR